MKWCIHILVIAKIKGICLNQMLHPIYFSTFEKCQEHFTIPNYFHIYLWPLKMTYFFFSGVLLCINIIQTYFFVQQLKICWIKNVPWLWFHIMLSTQGLLILYISHYTWSNKSILPGIQAWSKTLVIGIVLYCFCFIFFFFFSVLFVIEWCHAVSKPTNLVIKYHIWQASIATPHTWVLCLQTRARS